MHRHFTLLTAGTLALAACGDDEVTEPLPELEVTTSELPAASQGVDYEADLEATGGVGPYRWTGGDQLPAGLFLRSEGDPDTKLFGRPESGGSFSFTLSLRDQGTGIRVEQTYDLEISEAPPEVMINTGAELPEASFTADYEAFIEASNGNTFEWRRIAGELPVGLQFDEASLQTNRARIFGRASTEDGPFSFTMRVRNDRGESAEADFTIQVVDDTPGITQEFQNLDNAIVGFEQSWTLRATGGDQDNGYTWSVITGELPPGLTLQTDGTPETTISGTPTEEGSYTFRVEVRDQSGERFDRTSYSITVVPAPPPVRIPATFLAVGRVGDMYEQEVLGVGGAEEQDFDWDVVEGRLPNGLMLTAGKPRATISGTPLEAGTFVFTLQLSTPIDSTQEVFTLEIEEQVFPVELTVMGTDVVDLGNGIFQLPPAEGGAPYDQVEFVATQGAPLPDDAPASEVRYNYALTGGDLPPGMNMVAAGQGVNFSGRIGGVPSALATVTATITVFDRENQTDSVVVQFQVIPPSTPLVIVDAGVPTTLPTCKTSNVDIAAVGGGNADFQWRVSSGALPPGFEITPTGTPATTLSGTTDLTPGTYTFELEVLDGFGTTARRSFTITVANTSPPSERFIAFVGDLEVNGRNDVYVMDISEEGSTPVRVNPIQVNGDGQTASVANNGRSDDLAFSPDGTRLAFLGSFGSINFADDAYVVNLCEGNPEGGGVRVTSAPQSGLEAQELRWSPDGSKLAILGDFTNSSGEELWISRMDPVNGPQPAVRVSESGFSGREVYFDDYMFSPNSQRIAFVADFISSDDAIWVVDLSGPSSGWTQQPVHSPNPLFADVNGGFLWSPDSRVIVFNADFEGTTSIDTLYFSDVSGAPPFQETRIHPANVFGGDVQINFTLDLPEHFAFCGNKLFFIGDIATDNSGDLWITDYANGAFSTPIAAATLGSFREVDDALWSPSCDKIVFQGDLDAASEYNLFMVDVSGTNPTAPARIDTNYPTTFSATFDYSQPQGDYQFACNGNAILYVADVNTSGVDELNLVRFGPTGPEAPIVINSSGYTTASDVWAFRVSPDGQKVAYLADETSSVDELFLVENLCSGTPTTPVRMHESLGTNTSLDAAASFSSFVTSVTSFYWTADSQKVVSRADLEVAFAENLYMFDVSGTAPYTAERLLENPASTLLEVFSLVPSFFSSPFQQ